MLIIFTFSVIKENQIAEIMLKINPPDLLDWAMLECEQMFSLGKLILPGFWLSWETALIGS